MNEQQPEWRRRLWAGWARWKLRACHELGRGATVKGRIWIHGDGKVRIGSGVVLDASLAPIELHAGPESEIVIGDGVWIEGGTSIEAQNRVDLRAGCRVGPFCKIIDNHFHPISGDRRGRRPPSVPVILEEGCVLHGRVILLPGTYMGKGCTALSGTVISRRIPAGSTVEGVPGRVIPPARS
jgi:acetyltransferase-like isoleucine patch superfamily enzyme